MRHTHLIFTLFTLAVSLHTPSVLSFPVINEIMYDPDQCDDSDCEWIELYNNGNFTFNLTGWTVDGRPFDAVTLLPGQYLVIARELTDGADTDIESFESRWGNGDGVWNSSDANYTAVDGSFTLANSADVINLTNGTHSVIVNYTAAWGADGNGLTLCRISDGNGSFSECAPTPGTANQPIPPAQVNVGLSVYLSSPALLGILYTSLFRIEIVNKANCTVKDNVSVAYNITNSSGALVKESNFSREIGCSGWAHTGEWTPTELGNFTLCGQVVSSTVNETDLSDNSVCKSITVVESPLTVIHTPTQAGWGTFNLVWARWNATYYGWDRVKFLIYGKSRRVVAGLDWTKIKAYAECQGDTAIELNVTSNQTHFLTIPLLLYPNCDGYYSDGIYELVLRVCRPAWKKYLDHTFSLHIEGENSRLCPKPETRVIYREVVSAIETEPYRILLAPTSVRPGEEFEVVVSLENHAEKAKNVTIYSYVYARNRHVSEGWTGERWSRAWTANLRQLTLAPITSTIMTLTNRVRASTPPGDYRLRVRIEGETDLTRTITVLPPLAPISANMTCVPIEGTVMVRVKNVGRETNFTLIALQEGVEVRDVPLAEDEEMVIQFDRSKSHFLLIHEGTVLANCTILKGSQTSTGLGITGQAVEGPNPIWELLDGLRAWLGSIIRFLLGD